MSVPRDRVRNVAATAGWIAAVLPLAVVLLSVALSPASNWIVRATLAGFCVLAIARPEAAFLVTTALVGFGTILSHLAGVPPLRVTEVLVVGSLAGCCIRAIPHGSFLRRPLASSISVPVVLFAIAVVASTIVWQRVYQFETRYPSDYFRMFWQFLSRAYFVEPGDFWVLIPTAVLLEGLALYVAVAALCRADHTFFERSLRMLALGGAGLGLMSVVRLAEIYLRNPAVIQAMRASGALRISPQIADLIAAGSYFALCWLVTLGLAMATARRRLLWVAVGVPLVAALYLTGSRSVIAAPLAGLVVAVFLIVRQGGAVLVRAAAAVVVLAVVMVISYPWLTGRDVAGELARLSVETRVELARAGLRVIATRPLFGVGVDRFYLAAGSLASPRLNALWPARKNPHNDFLRVGAELGLVGLGLFLWILAAAARRTWQALRRTRDPRLAGLVGGLVAFLVTSMVSDPLMVREVSYVFWIALGLAVGHSAAAHPAPAEREAPTWAAAGRHWRVSMPRWPIAVLLGSLLLASVPFRSRQELASMDLTHVSYGLTAWDTEPDGRQYRWSGPRATLFVDGRARLVEIPLSGRAPSGAPQQVEIRVDGRLANRVAVVPEWQRVRTLLPSGSVTGLRRIDLMVSPTWVPAEAIPGSRDRRVRGVKVGELTVR